MRLLTKPREEHDADERGSFAFQRYVGTLPQFDAFLVSKEPSLDFIPMDDALVEVGLVNIDER